MNFVWVAFGILALAFLIEVFMAPDAGRPPDIEKALEDFSDRYADAAINDIRMTRDEDTRRSFSVQYRNKKIGTQGMLELHYSNRGGAKWVMDPVPPETLP